MSDEVRTKAVDEIFCSSCGAIIKKEAEICPKCGVRQKVAVVTTDPADVSKRSRLVASLLCFFFGIIGVHRFYCGKITSGIMQILFSWATLFIWNLVDLIMILSGSFKDKEGKLVKIWNPNNIF